MACNAARRFDYFFYRKSDSVAKVENIALAAFVQILKRKIVRLRKVAYVDVVANAGAVLSIVVIAKD